MKVKDIYEYIDKIAPFSYALDYDNCGLLVGDAQAEVTGVLVALDCTMAAVEMAKEIGAGLILTHHPVIFDPLRAVLAGSVVHTLVQNGISVISAHTNYDIARGGTNDLLAKALGLGCLEGFCPITCRAGEREVVEYLGRISFLKEEMAPETFAAFVKETLGTGVRFNPGGRPVKRVAVMGGAGGKYLFDAAAAGADAFVTAEIDHHLFLEAASLGITAVDAGHFFTERVLVAPLAQELGRAFPAVTVTPFFCSSVQAL